MTVTPAAALAGCGPIAFSDESALAIVGDLPAPPPKPVVVEKPKPKRVEVRGEAIVINEKIQFDFNKATIRSESDSLMEEIAKVIKENPHIKKISIEGHTSAEGSDKYNLKLSDKRAKAVLDHLVSKGGIPKEMLTAKGFGESKPIAGNDTEEDREKNRRVEFNITEQDVTRKKVEIDPETGQERVLEEKTKTVTAGGDEGK